MRRRMHNPSALARLARVEEQFIKSGFLAPVARGAGVRVKIAGVVCEINIDPPGFVGWGVFRPTSHKRAKLDRPATMKQRQDYLDLFPRVQLMVCHHDDCQTLAVPANRSDSRFRIDGAVEVNLAEDVAMFDSILARFDGSRFWFDQIDPAADPLIAAYLRQALLRMVSPESIARRGLSAMQIDVYAQAHRQLLAECEKRNRAHSAKRIGVTLAHAGAALRDIAEQGDAYRVTYDIAGSRHVSVVRKNDLTVLSAGICLSGMDRQFDLNSMVGVLREAREVGRRG